MSAPIARIQPVRNPVLPEATTPEIRYWRGFRAPLLVKENNAVNHIHFNPASPHDLAFTSSTRIQILSSKTQRVHKTIAKFKDTVYSGEFRHDGKLLVAGDATGLIQCFDTSNRAALVTLKPTKYAVHVTKFHPSSLSTLLSASDDRVVRLWDLTSSDPLVEYRDHTDYVRSATFVASLNLIATGSYDGYVRLYDPRVTTSEGPVVQFYHKEPVESVLSLSETTLASAGGPMVKIWDLTAGKKIRQLGNFQKTVTCLASAGERGLLAGSLDGHVKVFDSHNSEYPVTFGWKYGAPVLSTGISPNLRQLATGLTTGLLSVRTRKTEPKAALPEKQAKSGNFARMIRGAEYHGELEHQTMKGSKKKTIRLKQYEKHIKAFRWSDALDSAFQTGVAPEQTVMVLEELRNRGKVVITLTGRDEDSLEPLFKWCLRSIHDTRATTVIADWIGTCIDMYGSVIEKSPILSNLLSQLQTRVNSQVAKAVEVQKIEGMLDLLMA